MPAPSLLPRLTPVICGPTAGGKSSLAVDLALALRDQHNIPAEIVTADAFQVYRGLDIGTAKPTPSERRGVPHHLIDIVNPLAPLQERGVGAGPRSPSDSPPFPPFTLDDWLRLARAAIADLRSRDILPIVVGGTHLYVKALLEGIFEGPDPDPALRAALMTTPRDTLRAELQRIDPPAAARIHPNDLRRTVRAIEVFRLTGKPITAHQKQWDQPRSEDPSPATPDPKPDAQFFLCILDWETEPLNRRINSRVRQMVDDGLVSEVRTLLAAGLLLPQAAEALGYKQLIPVVCAALAAGQWPPPPVELDAAIEQIKIETRRFGKNQRTWLRRLRTSPGAISIPMPQTPPQAALHRLLAAVLAGSPQPQ